MDRSKLAVGAAWVVTLALVAWLVVRVVWFFNPFTFRQDAVTHLPWSWYQRPIQLEYTVWGEGNDRTLKITDQKEVALVFRELRKGLGQGADTGLNEGSIRVDVGMRVVRTRANVFYLRGNLGHDVMFLSPNSKRAPVKLTPALRQLFAERFAQAGR